MVALVGGLIGCAGDLDPVDGEQNEILARADATPLPSVDSERWRGAVAGCEGRIADGDSFGIAAGQPELVVAMHKGSVHCVDSYSAIESELADQSKSRADRLWLGYVAALQEIDPVGIRRIDAPAPQ